MSNIQSIGAHSSRISSGCLRQSTNIHLQTPRHQCPPHPIPRPPPSNNDKNKNLDRHQGYHESYFEQEVPVTERTIAPPSTPRGPVATMITPASNRTTTSIPGRPSRSLELATSAMKKIVTTTTPQAILSRTPQALIRMLASTISHGLGQPDGMASSGGGVTMADCDIVRHKIAQDMIVQTKSGKRNKLISDHNSIGDCESRNENGTFDSTCSYQGANDNGIPTFGPTRYPLISGGTISVRQSLKFQSNIRSDYEYISLDNCKRRPLAPSIATTTGCHELDDLLHLIPPSQQDQNDDMHRKKDELSGTEGLDPQVSLMGNVLQLSGPSGSYKTMLALQIALEFALLRSEREATIFNDHSHEHLPSYQVMYLTSRAGHSSIGMAKRFQQMVNRRGIVPPTSMADGNRRSANTDGSDSHPIFSAISFYDISNSFQLLQQLARIEDRLWHEFQQHTEHSHSSGSTGNLRLGMIVIDSIYQIAMVNDQQQQQTNMAVLLQVGHVLKRLVRQYSISIVVTNGVVRARPKSSSITEKGNGIDNTSSPAAFYKPALGETWHHVAVDLHLGLEPADAHLATSLSMPPTALLPRDNHSYHNSANVCVTLKQHVSKLVGDFSDDCGQHENKVNDDRQHQRVYLRSTTYGLQGVSSISGNAGGDLGQHGNHGHGHSYQDIPGAPPPTKRSRPSPHALQDF